MQRQLDPRTEQAILLISTRFREALALPDIAAGVGLSTFHFHRLFKADTGETPAAYLARVRLEHAAHLIVILPDAPLLQIALDSGFSSAATFARAFRQYLHLTPSEYRQQNKLVVNAQMPSPALRLRQLPERRLRVTRCALDEIALTNAYRQLGRQGHGMCAALGIFVDAPFHQERASCRHFLALETDTCADPADSLLLPAGLYACLPVHGDIDALSQSILRFNTEQLQPSAYAIASTLAFERVLLPAAVDTFDYRLSEREVFIKVRRKNEQVI